MYGPPPRMPEVKNNPGVGRPPGSSNDPVNIPVSGSAVLAEEVQVSEVSGNKPVIPPWPLNPRAVSKPKGRPRATEPTLVDCRNIARANNIQGTSHLNPKSMKDLLSALRLI